MSDSSENAPCCLGRRKFKFNGIGYLSQEECGVSDAEIADFLILGAKSPEGRPVVVFKFCPWCGAPWKLTGGVREIPARREGHDLEDLLARTEADRDRAERERAAAVAIADERKRILDLFIGRALR
jgi:hypothetical protein